MNFWSMSEGGGGASAKVGGAFVAHFFGAATRVARLVASNERLSHAIQHEHTGDTATATAAATAAIAAAGSHVVARGL